MGRRDRDTRPAIEVVGDDSSGMTSLQQISTRPPRPTRGRGRALGLGAGVVVLLLGGLALSDDDTTSAPSRPDRPDTITTTTRRTTTTREPTTTTTIPEGPVFGQPVGASLLAYGQSGWELVDLDTGARREVVLPTEDPYGMVVVTGGVAGMSPGSRQAMFYGLLSGTDRPAGVSLGEADQVLAAEQPDRLWLVTGIGFEGEPTQRPGRAQLVDLQGRVLRSFDVPRGHVSVGTSNSVILARGGRVYEVDGAGVRAIATGYVLASTGGSLLLVACDDRAECSLLLQPIDGGRGVELIDLPGPDEVGFDTAISIDGEIAVMGYGDGGGRARLSLFDADGRSLGVYADTSSFNGLPRWLPGGVGLVAPVAGEVHRLTSQAGEWVAEAAPGLAGIEAEVLFVIRR